MFFGGGFPGMGGGMPGGMGGGMGRPQKAVDTEGLYKILGVPKDCSSGDLKKAFRKLAVQHHPDKGGDPEKFKDITHAYEILSDEEKRAKYDQYGEEGLEGGGEGHDPSDIFNMFFGGGGGGGSRQPRQRKTEDIAAPIKVTLAQLYTGCTRKLAINKRVLCGSCKGEGGDVTKVQSCNTCDGKGVVVMRQQMGPMISHVQRACPTCQGQGKSMPAAAKCNPCKGSGLTDERKVIECVVPPGAPNGHRIVFKGEADQKKDHISGDVIVVVEEEEDKTFQRKGDALFMKREISLTEALTGFSFVVKHLDDRILLLKSVKNQVYKPGDLIAIEGEGMPTRNNAYVKGKLVVELSVAFPKTLADADVASIKAAMPLSKDAERAAKLAEAAEADQKVEIHYFSATTADALKDNGKNNRQAYDDHHDESEDDHHHGGAQGVQCAQA